jgi:hypothetical protein
MNKDSENSQITSQNIFSVSPRFALGFEAYLPISFHEISGTTAGLGFRLSGFLGSNSILTQLQAIVNMTFIWDIDLDFSNVKLRFIII